ADGTFRLIDYKLGWPPDRTRALQLPIYGVCAEQRLAEHRGDRRWMLGEAVYIAFGGPRRVVPLFAQPADRDEVLRAAQQRLVGISISTIDAFCLALVREFPLEADIDPGFELADDTEVPRLIEESLDQALRICRSIAGTDDDVSLVFAQLGERRLRAGLASL